MEYTQEQIQSSEVKLKDGIAAGIPIAIGYIPAAMAFGLMAKAVDVSLFNAFLFSVLVFAGASQFMAINLISTGVAAGEIILATLLLNMRHLLMSASLAAKLNEKVSKWTPLVAFGITDETFSVAATRQDKLGTKFVIALNTMAYSAWVGGTVLGYVVGEILPPAVQSSMGVALYAMFIAILIPAVKKSISAAILACGAGLLNTLLNAINLLPSGWNLITAISLTAIAGAIFFKDENEGRNNER